MTSSGPAALLTIGALGRLSGLSTKALRHYDRIGLLHPHAVDADTAYRRYAPDQVTAARTVRLLRSLDLPLDEVRTCLEHPEQQAAIVRRHRVRLDARTTRLRGVLHTIDHLLADTDDDGTLEAPMPDPTAQPAIPVDDQRRLAIDLFNGVWRLMEQENRTPLEDDRMLHMAHASRYHWGEVGAPENFSRGEWQVSRVYAVLGRAEPSRHHAERSLQLCQDNGIGDWDLAFAYEALARAYAVAGDRDRARDHTEQALAAAEDIVESGDRELVLSDLETIPGQPRFW